MEQLENKFTIRRVQRSSDEDYIAALRIYNESTPVDIKTNTNEITHWLDKRDSNPPFELLLFILYLDGKIVGFAMMSYLKSNRIVVIDYIALYDQYRVNAVFFPYISLLQSYLNESSYDVAYIVNEVSNKNEGRSIDKESRLFKKLFCLEGFGRVEGKYYTPPLGNSNHESTFDAFLYIKSSDNIKTLTRDTYLNMIRAIYNDYFVVWYGEFLDKEEMGIYQQKIAVCMQSIEKSLASNDTLNVAYVECPILGGAADELTYGVLPAPKKRKLPVMPFLVILIITCPLLVIWLYTFVLELIGIPMSSVATIVGSFMSAIITAVSATLLAKKKS